MTMNIHNNTREPIELIWFSRDCQEILYHTIAAGDRITQQTFNNDLWAFRKSDGRIVERFAADIKIPDRTYAEPFCPGYPATQNFSVLRPIVLQQGQVFTMSSAGGVSGATLQYQGGGIRNVSVDFACQPGTKSVIIELDGTYSFAYAGSGQANREAFTFGSDNGCSVAVTDAASLISAIETTQSDTCPGPDSIILTQDVTFTSGAYTVATVGGSLAFPTVNSDVTIEGNGHTISRATDAGTPDFGFFYVYAQAGNTASLTLNNITLTGANMHAVVVYTEGGEALVTITDAIFSNNHVPANRNGGGAIAVATRGSGIARLNITGTSFTGNTAERSGGAIWARADIGTGSNTIVTIRESTFSGNSAQRSGDTIYNWPSRGTAEIILNGTSYDTLTCFSDDTGTLMREETCQ